MRCKECSTTNPKGMNFCGNCGLPLEASELRRERRKVSIVFIDLSGFSTITHGFTPEELRDLADEVLTVVANIIEDYDGYVDAFTGDGLIALFGAPHSHPDDAYRAVKASFKSLQKIEAIGDSREIDLKGRAGVNTGTVIAGSIGSGRVQEYTVMGSAVNLASRIEAAAFPGEVWVGPETYRETAHKLHYEKLENVSLKSYPDINKLYKLISIKSSEAKDPYGDLRFIGRDSELKILNNILLKIKNNKKSETLWITGEAGIGKTRLANEFCKEIIDKNINIIKIEELFLNIEGIWQQFAEQILVEKFTNTSEFKSKISEYLKIYLVNEERWQKYILESLGFKAKTNWQRLERRQIERSFLAWRDFLLAITVTEEKPLLIIVEHSSRGSRLGIFLELLNNLDTAIFIIRTNRKRLTEEDNILNLERLEQNQALELINQIADPKLKLASQALVAQVGRVPANILELGRSLNLQESNFSSSLSSLLQARFDKLSPIAKQVLGYCALIGQNSWKGLITELVGETKIKFLNEILDDKILIIDESSSIVYETQYKFQSKLIHQAVLKTIPNSERPRIHLKIASWLETHASEMSVDIARHFLKGNFQEAAYPHLLKVAEAKSQNNDIKGLTKYFEIVLGLELAPRLLALASLKYAQIAIGLSEFQLANSILFRAKEIIERCEGETKNNLRIEYQEVTQSLKKPNSV